MMSQNPQSGPNSREPLTSELVERALEDRRAGFEGLYERVAPAIYSWAALSLREPLRARLDPEDVLQEVSCRAYEAFERFDPQADFRAWVFGIARKVLYRALREYGREGGAAPALQEEMSARPDLATSITQRVARTENMQLFLDKARSLPLEERRLLVHRGLEGLPFQEVAARLGLSSDTATKRWRRLRSRLSESAWATVFLSV